MHRAHSRRWFTRLRRVLVCAVLAYALAVSLFSDTPQIIGAAIAFLGAGLLVWWACSRVAAFERAPRLAQAADVTATNVALTLLFMEVSLSIYAAASGSLLLVHDNISAYRLLPNHDYGRLWTNSSGYPSREFVRDRGPGRTRVVLLGDSFAVGSVRQDVNFASGIERLRPDVDVYNFGVSAIGPEDYRVILQTEALAFDPDVVLVAFFVGNDLTERPVGPALDDHALGRFSVRGWHLLKEWFRQRASAAPSPRSLPQLSTPAVPEKGFTLSRQRFLELERERMGISRLSLRAAHESGWASALAHLRAMRDECQRRGIVFAVAFIPDEFQVNQALLDELLAFGPVPRDDIDLKLPQRRLLDFCRAEDVPCLDLLPLFEGRRDAYLPQDTHWNETGNLIAAEALAAWLDVLRHDASSASELSLIEHGPPRTTR